MLCWDAVGCVFKDKVSQREKKENKIAKTDGDKKEVDGREWEEKENEKERAKIIVISHWYITL